VPAPENPDVSFPDPVQLSHSLARVAERSQRLVLDFLTRAPEFPGLGMADPQNVGNAFLDLTTKMLSDQMALARAQLDLWTEHARLWITMTQRMFGLADGSADTRPSDPRFRDPAWSQVAVFDYIKQSYLITAESILSTVRGVEGLDPQTARKVNFYTRQFVDAIAPSNFIATNPEVLRATLETGGENLLNASPIFSATSMGAGEPCRSP
jgi:polyhydroxyalkanoate synthase